MSKGPLVAMALGALLLGGCGGASSTASAPKENLAYLYGRDAAVLRVEARIHHASPDRSVIYFKLHTRDLLYKGEGGGGPYTAAVNVTYEAFAAGGYAPLDSATTRVRDRSDDPAEDKELIGSMEMRRSTTAAFTVKVTAYDVHRDVQSSVMLRVPATTAVDRRDFLPSDARTGLPLFDDHLDRPGPVKVLAERFASRPMLVERYRQAFKLPAPVFSEGSATAPAGAPDSTFTVMANERGAFELDLGSGAFYHIRPDSASREGLTLFVLENCYPEVRRATDMLPPLRYITSMQEWERISTASDRRRAVEKFWLDAAGDRERARDAIRAFYGRVESANRNFTSLVEGWRTDRGLVHIIFGPPSTVRRTAQGETWVYGEENNMMSLTFQFVRRESPFTDNDLQLDRDPVFKGAWYRNVEAWRNGRIYQN
jgi:GWxTD domain-containing protein